MGHEALDEDRVHDPEQGLPCADGASGRRLGQGERSPSNKLYLQRVTEWTAICNLCLDGGSMIFFLSE